MSDDIIAKAWQAYDALLLPNDAGRIQRTETRKAFFAGAAVLFHVVTSAMDQGDEEPTEADLALMDSLDRELREFGQEFYASVLRRKT